ncbi:MAG: hypothetical protein GC151_19050 [Betaproteobacteria bacterium]|nr:hypothetical protein [Betaproteobacteria bacterium]
MKAASLIAAGIVIGSGLFGRAALADNCSGYDVLVTTSAQTRDLGNGMSLTAFTADSVLTSDSAVYNLATGQCAGTTLATPDGKVRSSGHCARRDKDGDTESIEWSVSPGADRGAWKATGGSGKFANRNDSGWFRNVRADGNMSVTEWGGTCN